MTRQTYETINSYMQNCMKDSAHDHLHIYRVLSQALKIARSYEVDLDVLAASCLLHDIGRQAQFENPEKCHAVEGGKLAYDFLKKLGWEEDRCRHVKDCITTHRFRAENPPSTIEAKILFDADKLDVTGALGIARSLMYEGQVGVPLYAVNENFQTLDGSTEDTPESFLKEYHFKLIRLYDRFYTPEASAMAQRRKELTKAFYDELIQEIDISDLQCQFCMDFEE